MADFVVMSHDLTYETCPSMPGASTFPIVFQDSIPFRLDFDCTYVQISNSHIMRLEININASFDGYSRNGFIPYLRIAADDASKFYTFDIGSMTLSNITGYAKTYDNGTLTSTVEINSGNINNYNTYTRSSSMFDNHQITIRTATIPVIFENINALYPDIYYYNGQFDDLKISSGYLVNKCLNKKEDVIPEGVDMKFLVQWTTGNWTSNQQPPVTNVYYQGFRGTLTDGRFCLFLKPGVDDGKLKYIVYSSAVFYNLEKTTDGINWVSVEEFPWDFMYRKHINELGNMSYALSIENIAVPIFSDPDKAQDYIDEEIGPEEADNWDEISDDYPEDEPGIGDDEDETEFGEVYSRQVFSQLYLCNIGALLEISNSLFDYDVTTLSGLWEDIKKGLEMYGTNPMEVVQGLRYYPFDLSQIFSDVQGQNYIYFGAYQLNLTQGSVKKIIYANGYLDLGTIPITRRFKDWRDFEPYTKVSVYLPYIGIYPLDVKKYYGKNVNIRYYIDLRTGACTACLIANGVLLDYFDGIIGTEMPITLTDYSSYAQSQLNIIMRNAGLGIAGEAAIGNIGVKTVRNAMNYNDNVAESGSGDPFGSLASQTAGIVPTAAVVGGFVAAAGGVAVGTAMKTAFDVMQNGTAAHTKTKPASSAMINQYLPQYPFFRTEYLEIDESPYLNELYGRPSNASGTIANFSGYLEADDIMLICPIATDNERQEIIDLVRSGIYL